MKKKDVQNLLKIDSGTTIRFDNAHHAEFHRQQYEDVLAVAPAKLKLPAGLLEEWKKNIDLEVAINKESDKSVQTAQMMAKDKELHTNQVLQRRMVLSTLSGIVQGPKRDAIENRWSWHLRFGNIHLTRRNRNILYLRPEI